MIEEKDDEAISKEEIASHEVTVRNITMPRIYTSTNDPIDFCQGCFPNYEQAEQEYGNIGNGPDERGNCFEYDAQHPPYAMEEYYCACCGRSLSEDDDEYDTIYRQISY